MPTSEGGGCPPASRAVDHQRVDARRFGLLRVLDRRDHVQPLRADRAEARAGARAARPASATMTGIFSSRAISQQLGGARAVQRDVHAVRLFRPGFDLIEHSPGNPPAASGPAASTPSPPAFDTAMISGAFDDAQLIAAWKIGCSMPSSSVMRVFTSAPSLAVDQLARLAGELGQHAVRTLRSRSSVRQLLNASSRSAAAPIRSCVELAPGLAQREPHAARVVGVGRAQHAACAWSRPDDARGSSGSCGCRRSARAR